MNKTNKVYTPGHKIIERLKRENALLLNERQALHEEIFRLKRESQYESICVECGFTLVLKCYNYKCGLKIPN